MLTNYVFMIHIRAQSTKEVIKANLTSVYSIFEGSKYILSDRGSECANKQFTFLSNELGFTKIYT